MKLEKHHYFFLFVGFLFLGIVSINLFSDGMFLDGLLYADISRNMSEGLGSFWKPHLSNGLFKEFYEHPPLALGLQSLAFSVFGDSIFVERFYSLFTSIIVGYLIVLIWEKLTNSKKNAWIPLFLWNICKHYSAINNCNKEILDNNYDLVPIKTLKYKLYKRKEKKSNHYAN